MRVELQVTFVSPSKIGIRVMAHARHAQARIVKSAKTRPALALNVNPVRD